MGLHSNLHLHDLHQVPNNVRELLSGDAAASKHVPTAGGGAASRSILKAKAKAPTLGEAKMGAAYLTRGGKQP